MTFQDHKNMMFSPDDFAPLKIPLQDILSATNNFSKNNSIGKIDFGNHHMGSLENYLSDSRLLTWVRRLEISVGVANALSYIHYDESRDFSVIHRNIDSETIMLNDNWEPKLIDFRLSMKIKPSERRLSFDTDKVLNTMGYTNPTCLETKSVSHKSDIYSFGIVMFELLCGRESVIANDYNKYLAPVAITHYREKKLYEIIDWGLLKQMDSQSLNMFAEIAYDCLKEERSQRPDIDEIVPRLVKALELARENMPIIPSPKDDLAHLKIPLENILTATNNFAYENVIGTAGLRNSYRGQLSWSGELIITPSALNINGFTRVPKQRGDGWMEIQLWKFNSAHEFKDDSLSIDMKFTSHEGTMSGLIVCGLEFRPVLEVKDDGLPLLLDSLRTENDKMRRSGGLQSHFLTCPSIYTSYMCVCFVLSGIFLGLLYQKMLYS